MGAVKDREGGMRSEEDAGGPRSGMEASLGNGGDGVRGREVVLYLPPRREVAPTTSFSFLFDELAVVAS